MVALKQDGAERIPKSPGSRRTWRMVVFLSSCSQAGSQPWRQVRRQDALLGILQVVGHTAERHYVVIGIEQGKGGSPVAVTRLPDRSGVDQVTHPFLHRNFNGFALPDGFVRGTENVAVGVAGGKTSLQMSMSEEGQGHVREQQWL